MNRTPRKPGRPALPPSEVRSPVKVYLTAPEILALDQERGSVPRSEWLAIKAGLRAVP